MIGPVVGGEEDGDEDTESCSAALGPKVREGVLGVYGKRRGGSVADALEEVRWVKCLDWQSRWMRNWGWMGREMAR